MDIRDGFIAGIFNYCDQWCSACAFTSRCRGFALEAEFAARCDLSMRALVDAPRRREEERGNWCASPYMPHGVDLRLLEEGDIRRTQLHRRPETVAVTSAEWRAKLLANGWEQAE